MSGKDAGQACRFPRNPAQRRRGPATAASLSTFGTMAW